MPAYVPGSLGPSTLTNLGPTKVATAAPYAVVGGAPWAPDQASGLQLWLKADSIAQADNTAVSSWIDSSATSGWATQTSAPNQPTFRTNIISGLPVVRFNGTSSWLSSSLSAANKPVTIAAVVKVTSSGAGEAIAGAMAGGGSEYRIAPSGQQDLLSQYVVDIGNGSTSVGTTAFNVLRVTYDASGNYAFFLNGVADGSGLNNQTFSATTRIIGANASGGGIEYLPGDLAEYVEYNTALSTADGAALDTYLQQKWLPAAGPVAYFASLVATSLTVPNIQKAAAKTLAVAALTVPAFQKAISKTLSATSLTVAALATFKAHAGIAYYATLTATSTTVASMQKAIGKGFAVTTTTVPAIRKSIAKTLKATSLTVASLIVSKGIAGIAYFATLAATSTSIATMQKAIGKNLTAISTATASITKSITKTLTAPSATVPSVQKAITKTLSAVSLSVPTLATFKAHAAVAYLALGKLISASGAGILRSRSGIGNLIARAGTGAIKTRSGIGWLVSRSGLGNLRSK